MERNLVRQCDEIVGNGETRGLNSEKYFSAPILLALKVCMGLDEMNINIRTEKPSHIPSRKN